MIHKLSGKLLLSFVTFILSFGYGLTYADTSSSVAKEKGSKEDSDDSFFIENPEFAEEYPEEDELVSDDDFYTYDYSDDRLFFTIETLLGGSTLERVTFDNGESDSIRAGSGVYLALGIAHLMFDKSMDVGIKGGYLFDLITAKNEEGDKTVLSFTRKPVDFFSHAWFDRHCLGGGLTIHFDPVFKSRKTHHRANYENAFGAYAEYLYHFEGAGSALGIKYQKINYKNEDTGHVTDGSGWGITFNKLI